MEDFDTMRFVAGGDRADEIAECAGRWADSKLEPAEVSAVLRAGGYDPDPFVVLAARGLLFSALYAPDGRVRAIHGERAGVWISDELALASPEEVVERTLDAIDEVAPT